MGVLIFLSIVTAYLAGAVAAAPRLMRLIYQDNLAEIAEEEAAHEKRMQQWRKGGGPQPFRYHHSSQLRAMQEARVQGAWYALVWPVSLTYHRLAGTAFKQEIAAQKAAANTKIIKDYERLLHESFDKELAGNARISPLRRTEKLRQCITFTKEKS